MKTFLPPLVRSPLVLALALLGTVSAAEANTLYKCTDRSGSVLYTNQKSGGKSCVVLSQMAGPSASPGRSGSSGSRPRASANPTPSDFPRVSSSEQKSRDGDRKAILDKELNNELQNLEKAKKAIADAGAQPPDKVQPLRDTVALHERNVEALKKELGNLR